MKRAYSSAAIMVGLLLTTPTFSGWAQVASATQPVTGITMATKRVAEGQVTAVDLGARTVTVMLSNGRSISGGVSEGVGGLDLAKVGDRVEATFEERLS